MSNRHAFLFEGGEYLTTMSASWFVSYLWYDLIDKNHDYWKAVSTYKNRISVYNKTKKYRKIWLSYIIEMKTDNLNKNSIGLSGEIIKHMAKDLYNSFEKN